MGETYMDRLKVDLAEYLGLPESSVVESIQEDVYYREGCPTCGGDYEFTVYVRWKDSDGNFKYKSYEMSLTDFLSTIQIGS